MQANSNVACLADARRRRDMANAEPVRIDMRDPLERFVTRLLAAWDAYRAAR